MSLDEAEDAWAADKAREAAEARRKRILEAANARMGLVEGTATAAYLRNTTSENADAGEKAGQVHPKADADDAAADASTTTTTTTSSKIAAMRRRRFKKTTVHAPAATTTATTEITEKEEEEETPKDEKEEAPAATATAAAALFAETRVERVKESDQETEDVMADTAVVSEENNNKHRQADVIITTLEEEIAPESEESTAAATNEAKKKYLGVAKMRRRMIKERQQNQDNEGAMFTTTDTSIADAVIAKLKKKKKRPVVATLPILMHAVTVLLLFLAGLDVGLQQGAVDYSYGGDNGELFLLQVHSELAPRKLGGLQRILSMTTVLSSQDASANIAKAIKPTIVAEPEWRAVLEHENDEFADDLSNKDDAIQPPGINVDPLFQVDLDKLTDGTGLYFFLARFAIRVHRLNLAIFYYGPRSFFQSLAALLLSMTRSPPTMCLTAILLRQFVGKFILGAKLPAIIEDETQHKDVLSMVKNFLSSFVLSSFPTAATLYDVWSHMRADMYVLLCGLFVGLAWSHNSRAGSPYGSDNAPAVADTTETAKTTVPAGVVVDDGIADEL